MIEKDYILRVKDLRTEFRVGKRTVHAVNGATFDLERGKTLCVVGESGCGKTRVRKPRQRRVFVERISCGGFARSAYIQRNDLASPLAHIPILL